MTGKKWWQTGEFADGYQLGDIFRTVKNSVSRDKEKSGNKDRVKVTQDKKDTNKRYVGLPEIKNGRMSFDPVAQLYGFRDETERQNYIKENPNLYAVMGGVKYAPSTALKYDIPLSEERKKIVAEAQLIPQNKDRP